MQINVNRDAFLKVMGIDKEVFDKAYYIIRCSDFYYYPLKVHIIGCSSSSVNEEICYYVDIEDECGNNLEFYLYELERFKTLRDAKKYCDYLNGLEENKKRVKIWKQLRGDEIEYR